MSKIILYNNDGCPYAQRVRIVLIELGLEFDEVVIDLNKPREPWYLEINPRGLVPALKYGDHLITESMVITQFLVDLKASRLLPSPGSVDGALARARLNFFVDAFNSKVIPPLHASVVSTDEAEKAAKANQLIDAITNDIVPLLTDAAPFFGGSKELTLAEANTAPHIVRIYAFLHPDAGLIPAFLGERLRSIKTWQTWVDAVSAHKSVTTTFDEKAVTEQTKVRLAKMRQ